MAENNYENISEIDIKEKSEYIRKKLKIFRLNIDDKTKKDFEKMPWDFIINYFDNIQYIIYYMMDSNIDLNNREILELACKTRKSIEDYFLKLINEGFGNYQSSLKFKNSEEYTEEYHDAEALEKMYNGEIPPGIKPYPGYHGPTGPSGDDGYSKGPKRK